MYEYEFDEVNLMKIYRNENNQLVLSRDNGDEITFSWNESSLLYHNMMREAVWSEVEIRIPESDMECVECFGCLRDNIYEAKEDIIEELLPEFQDICADRIYDAINATA